jgi:hypothetical protein
MVRRRRNLAAPNSETEEDHHNLVVVAESECETIPEIDSKTVISNEKTRERVVRAREEGTTIHRDDETIRATAVLLRFDLAQNNNHLQTIINEAVACRPVRRQDPNALATIRENPPEEADRRAETGAVHRKRSDPDETRTTTITSSSSSSSNNNNNNNQKADSSRVPEEEEESEEEVEEREEEVEVVPLHRRRVAAEVVEEIASEID